MNNNTPENTPPKVIIYEADGAMAKISVRLEGETVWLTNLQLAQLFQCTKSTVSEPIKNIFDSGELARNATVRNVRTVQIEGSRKVERSIEYYNLDMIISLGYRINSKVATRFRQWATVRLREYIIKGFTMDDDRLKELGGGGYWKELLERIRDIRSSEKVFYRQILDIYATSMDYDPKADESVTFSSKNRPNWGVNAPVGAFFAIFAPFSNVPQSVPSACYPSARFRRFRPRILRSENSIFLKISSISPQFSPLRHAPVVPAPPTAASSAIPRPARA